jgi:hypothetical protein
MYQPHHAFPSWAQHPSQIRQHPPLHLHNFTTSSNTDTFIHNETAHETRRRQRNSCRYRDMWLATVAFAILTRVNAANGYSPELMVISPIDCTLEHDCDEVGVLVVGLMLLCLCRSNDAARSTNRRLRLRILWGAATRDASEDPIRRRGTSAKMRHAATLLLFHVPAKSASISSTRMHPHRCTQSSGLQHSERWNQRTRASYVRVPKSKCWTSVCF